MADRVLNAKQIFCDAIAQSMGANYFPSSVETGNKNLADLDSSKLVDVGVDVEEAGKLDAFTKALVVLVGKIDIDNRDFPLQDEDILKDNFEYGGMIENIRLGLYEVEDDPMWNLKNGVDYSSYDYTFHAPPVHAKMFTERKAIYIAKSFQRETVMEAFRSWDSVTSFLSAISTAWKNTLTVTINAWTKALKSAAVAISDKATGTARHLLTEAIKKKILPEGSTAVDFLNSDKAMLFALEEIRNTKSFMAKDMTVAFNDKTLPTFTPYDFNKLTLLTQFANRIKTLKANTYNDSEIGIGDFREVTSWQGIASTTANVTSYYDYNVNSTIKIAADATNKLGIGVEAYEKSNVIGLMWDYLAIGVCPEKTLITSNYAAGADFWNDHGHYTANRWINTGYNIVAFILD